MMMEQNSSPAKAEDGAVAASEQAAPAKATRSKQDFQWYAVQVMVRYEKKVAEKIMERAGDSRLAHEFAEIKIPSEQIMELKSGQKRQVERLLFPGYIMVRMNLIPETWQVVRHTPNVKGFIGAERHMPLPLSEEEMANIDAKTAVKEGGEVKTETVFEPGEMVRIVEGPFADFSGTVEEVSNAKGSLRVTISIFGRMTPTEVSFKQVVREWA